MGPILDKWFKWHIKLTGKIAAEKKWKIAISFSLPFHMEVFSCCIFRPAYGCCVYQKAGWNTFFSVIFNLYSSFQTFFNEFLSEIKKKLLKTFEKLCFKLLFKADWHANAAWLPEGVPRICLFSLTFFTNFWLILLKKEYFNQLSVVHSTQKLVKIYNIFSLCDMWNLSPNFLAWFDLI